MQKKVLFDYDNAPASTLYYQPKKQSRSARIVQSLKPIVAVIIIIAILIYRKPLTINTINFVVKNHIPLPEPIIQAITYIVEKYPDDYNFTLEKKTTPPS